MKLYLYFCASIFRFYVRKKDRMPEAMAFWVSSIILTANFFTMYNFLSYYYFPELSFNISIAFIFFGIIALINYFAIFYSGTFKDKIPSKTFGIGVILYLIFSLTTLIFMGSLQRKKNLEVKQGQHNEDSYMQKRLLGGESIGF